MHRSARAAAIAGAVALALFGAGEMAVRGLFDIKLYGADGEVGYWVLPDQEGGAPLTGSYAVNASGFATSRAYAPVGPRDLVLVGDSIVAGTSGLDQAQRLGARLEGRSGWTVWPLATGSWGLANQMRALRRVDLTGIEAIVFVLNTQDLGPPSAWTSEYDLPTREPRLHLVHALRKALPFLRGRETPMTIRPADLPREWQAFRASNTIPVVVFGYENDGAGAGACDWLPPWLGRVAACIDLVAMGQQHAMLDGMHPGPQGNAIMASAITESLERALPTRAP